MHRGSCWGKRSRARPGSRRGHAINVDLKEIDGKA